MALLVYSPSKFLRRLAAVHDNVDQFGSVNDDHGANLFLLDR
jgi:hypothetical protein